MFTIADEHRDATAAAALYPYLLVSVELPGRRTGALHSTLLRELDERRQQFNASALPAALLERLHFPVRPGPYLPALWNVWRYRPTPHY